MSTQTVSNATVANNMSTVTATPKNITRQLIEMMRDTFGDDVVEIILDYYIGDNDYWRRKFMMNENKQWIFFRETHGWGWYKEHFVADSRKLAKNFKEIVEYDDNKYKIPWEMRDFTLDESEKRGCRTKYIHYNYDLPPYWWDSDDDEEMCPHQWLPISLPTTFGSSCTLI